MKRRDFITLLGGAAVTAPSWPHAARAQRPDRMRVIGMLMATREDAITQARIAALRDALQALGWAEGRNVRFEVRWAAGDVERGRGFANELVQLAPDVIVANGSTAISVLKQATRSIPLVFVIVNDPVAQGYVPNVARPGANVTGFSYMDYSMIGKALQLLKEVVPSAARVGFMFNPDSYPYYETYLDSLRTQQQELAIELTALRIRSVAEIGPAFEGFAGADKALIVPPEPFTSANRKVVVDLAARHRLPTIYGIRDFVAVGGMMSYAPDINDIFRRSGAYVDRILKGASPSELPVQAPTRFEFVINQKTTKALGISVPANLLALADEVIE